MISEMLKYRFELLLRSFRGGVLLCAALCLGCEGAMESFSSPGKALSSLDVTKGPLSREVSSGNGEGYGGKLSGSYYSFGDQQNCGVGGSTGVFLDSIVTIDMAGASVSEYGCSSNPPQNLEANDIFSADYNQDILLLESGEVFERKSSTPNPQTDGYIEIFCRGIQIEENSGLQWDLLTGGIFSFQTPDDRTELWVDVIIRNYLDSNGNPTGNLTGDVHIENEIGNSRETIDVTGFSVDESIRSNGDIEYNNFAWDFELKLDNFDPYATFNEGEFEFEGGTTNYRADVLCTRGVK